jgi:hypothetical protein
MNKKTTNQLDQQAFFQQQQQQFHIASLQVLTELIKHASPSLLPTVEKAVQELLIPYLPKPNIQHTL